ncbi:hypothetical protein IMG5_105320 [Ichthyophthirius multifiliis]|uniref:Uncharacterized protein n=1 Tax=Ichthyophthirius multifiliis TaxID=5932 RepID=G0QT12_ICHMU|nr:hypothetical protein IMG5_105320 [Ichthyophthirius multifiliis]EGR31648.1 hypothetical protein IMG5_105320 [Ichthyophthirius multifiliis]|eukprot:XP_004035134.1 hypothetical protein IMG5_105320 [Ichthyophthirius multifiliis]
MIFYILFLLITLQIITRQHNIPNKLQGNILKCFAEIGKASVNIGQLAAIIATTKDTVQITNSVGKIFGSLDPLMRECSNPICLKEAYQRCEKDNQKCEQYGAIVYPKCNEGYYNWGCCVCTKKCPEGFTDNGLYCLKPKAYGRGSGYPWKFGDSLTLNNAMQRCQSENEQGCEQNGLVIYPKCKKGYHNVGCCICTIDCPEGSTDIGISCKKPETYGRGFGYPIHYNDCQNKSLLRNLSEKEQDKNFLSNLSCGEIKNYLKTISEKFISYQSDQSKKDLIIQLSIQLSELLSQFQVFKC